MRKNAPLTFAVVVLAGVVALGGCASASGSTSATPPPASSPTPFPAPTIHTIPLPGYTVSQISATAHGFVFNGAPDDGQPHPDGTLYYYSYATGAITSVAVAQPDPASGAQRDIRYVRAAGDVVTYLKADNNLAYWELDATNVVTGATSTLDSYTQEHVPGQAPFQGGLATDGASVVWSTLTRRPADGSTVMDLTVFDIASGATRAVTSSATDGYGAAIHGDTLVYIEFPLTATQTTPESMWRVNLPGGSPTRIGTVQGNVNLDISDQYAVWDEMSGSSGVTKGIALAGGASLPLADADCVRPLLADAYMVCQQIGSDLMLFDLRTGASLTFATGETAPYATVGGGRIVWLNADTSQAEYMLTPAS